MKVSYIIFGVAWALFNVFLLVGGVDIHGSIDLRHALEFAFLFAGAGIVIYIGFTKPDNKR